MCSALTKRWQKQSQQRGVGVRSFPACLSKPLALASPTICSGSVLLPQKWPFLQLHLKCCRQFEILYWNRKEPMADTHLPWDGAWNRGDGAMWLCHFLHHAPCPMLEEQDSGVFPRAILQISFGAVTLTGKTTPDIPAGVPRA